MPDGNIAYLDLKQFEDAKVVRGGVLVVDPTTEPLEFRCTDAVRPTTLQRLLWGKRLDGHLAANLLGTPLIKSLSQEFSIIAVTNLDFLELRRTIEVPVVLLTRDSAIEFESPAPGPTGKTETVAGAPQERPRETGSGGVAETVLSNTSGRYEPIVLRCHPLHKDDLETVRLLLAPIFATHDVMEPFERVASALQMVHQEETVATLQTRTAIRYFATRGYGNIGLPRAADSVRLSPNPGHGTVRLCYSLACSGDWRQQFSVTVLQSPFLSQY